VAVSEPVIARFEFAAGGLRGSELTLYRSCLVHRGSGHMETMPLSGIASMRVAFERDGRQLGWGTGLVLAALICVAISGPIGSAATQAAADLASPGGQGIARALIGFFRVVEAIAHFLPVVALGGALGGAFLIVRGWQGGTTLTVNVAGYERSYPARGRDALLLDFADAVSARLIAPDR
jgi:hypothetical protein